MKEALLVATLLASSLAHAGTAFYSHEEISGMRKICYYKYYGDTVAITIANNKWCPRSIQV